MGLLDTFMIPGNIKQIMLPFVLKPGSPLNIGPGSEGLSDDKKTTIVSLNTGAQHFSFRNIKDSDKYPAGFGRLQVLPSSMMRAEFGNLMKDDISYKLLYPNREGTIEKESIILDDIFNSIPCIQIREFLPDTRLDQLINFFGAIIQAVKDVFKEDAGQPQKKFDWNKVSPENIIKFGEIMLKYCTEDMYGAIGENLDKNFRKNGGNRLGVYDIADDIFNYNRLIMSFPYQMYYRLQSCTTTNIYTLPGIPSDKLLYSSSGSAGWGGGKSVGGVNEFVDKIGGVFATVAKKLLGNIQVHYMPFWDPESGSGTQPPEVSLTVNLFNDTAEAAMLNFIFVNTIVPNNLWIQYGMFQHSSNLYDIKLDGFNRLFACSGSFSVKGKGVLRDPPKKWIHNLVFTHGNFDGAKYEKGGKINPDALYNAIIANKLIKIPDVYEVTMKFDSLLPLNFNNYLYTYSQNNTIETEEQYKNGNVWEQSVFNDIINPAIKGVAEAVKRGADVFKSENVSANASAATAPIVSQTKDAVKQGMSKAKDAASSVLSKAKSGLSILTR